MSFFRCPKCTRQVGSSGRCYWCLYFPKTSKTQKAKTHIRAGDKTFCGRAITFPCIDPERERFASATCVLCRQGAKRAELKAKAVVALHDHLKNV